MATGTMTTPSREQVEEIVRQVVTARLGRPKDGHAAAAGPRVGAPHARLAARTSTVLFGPGYELTPDRPLYQEGNFAAKETVTLIGPRRRPSRTCGSSGRSARSRRSSCRSPTRSASAYDDAAGAASPATSTARRAASSWGRRAIVELPQGLIRAAIHVHMNPAEAAHYGVKQGDVMKLRVGGDAPVTFERVHVRIDPHVACLNVHMDTDEANACALHLATGFELFK